jgi:hypothetical protein
MNLSTKTQKVELVLRPHEVLTLHNIHNGMAIECRNGLIWVTCSGQHQDYMLRPGHRYAPQGSGNVVIEAIDDACVDIEDPS